MILATYLPVSLLAQFHPLQCHWRPLLKGERGTDVDMSINPNHGDRKCLLLLRLFLHLAPPIEAPNDPAFDVGRSSSLSIQS